MNKKIDYLLKNGVPKEQILTKHSSISDIDYVTHLRHLCLYLGIITFCYALTVALPLNFKFYHGSSILSARCTIVLDESHSEL